MKNQRKTISTEEKLNVIKVSYIFIKLAINTLLYRNVYIMYIEYICTRKVSMSTSGVVIHYISMRLSVP